VSHFVARTKVLAGYYYYSPFRSRPIYLCRPPEFGLSITMRFYCIITFFLVSFPDLRSINDEILGWIDDALLPSSSSPLATLCLMRRTSNGYSRQKPALPRRKPNRLHKHHHHQYHRPKIRRPLARSRLAEAACPRARRGARFDLRACSLYVSGDSRCRNVAIQGSGCRWWRHHCDKVCPLAGSSSSRSEVREHPAGRAGPIADR
jgi:hypothetical protein